MEFTEAHHYCLFAANAINSQRSTSALMQQDLNEQIDKFKINQKIQNLNFDDLCGLAVELTIRSIKNEGDSPNDKNSVAWFLGRWCYIMRNSCSVLNNEFDKIFIISWNRYFRSRNL